MKKGDQSGVITLEACISVLSFILLMFFLSGLFLMFMAQNAIAHTMLQSAQSMSLDAYATSKIREYTGSTGSVGNYLGSFTLSLFGSSSTNPAFVSEDAWYEEGSATIHTTVKNRFVGYLTGGDEAAANKLLKQMNVVDGLEGIDFSASNVTNGTLNVVLKYKLEYNMKLGSIGEIDVEQKCCSKLWK